MAVLAIDPGESGACVRMEPGSSRPIVTGAVVWRKSSDGRFVVDQVRRVDEPFHRARVHRYWEVGLIVYRYLACDGDLLIVEDVFLRDKGQNPASSFTVAKRATMVATPVCMKARHGVIGWVHPSTWRAAALAGHGPFPRVEWKEAAIRLVPDLVQNYGDVSGPLRSTEHLAEAIGLGVAAMIAYPDPDAALSEEDIEKAAERIRAARR